MLEASAQHPGRTGRETLTLAAVVAGFGRREVDAALDRVGLTSREAARRVKHYSLGMRQRLGLAAALLGQPRVLVLDEPANGLDPAGIRWMRTLLRGFADDGGTVLLSSHLLHEIEMVADDVVVIGRGKVVAQGPKDELLARAGTIVSSPDQALLGTALDRAGLEPAPRPGGGFTVAAAPEHVAQVALAAGVPVTDIRPAADGGLEELFLQLTAEDARETVGTGRTTNGVAA
jgi:ABC-2 type transport system ATP-binding protein